MISNIESPVGFYIDERSDKVTMHDRILADLDSARDTFVEKIEQHNGNYDFYKGKQWDDAEQASIRKQFRIPYVFNEIQHKVDHLVGTQTQTRMDSRVLAREKGDEAPAELLTFLLKWAEQVNDLEYVETEVFTDALIGGVGCSVVRWELEDINRGYPAVEKIPVYEMLWDANSRRMDLTDARWIARVRFVFRIEALEEYPEHRQWVDSAATAESVPTLGSLYTDYPERKRMAVMATNRRTSSTDRDIIAIVEYYERAKIYTYVVEDQIQGFKKTFDKEKDAKDFFEGLLEGYLEQGEILLNPDGSFRVAMVTNAKDAIWQSVMIGDEVVEYNLTDLADFPYVLNFAYFRDGDYWGFVNSLIDPQILLNRSFSQWDYQLGTGSKNPVTVVEPMLKPGFGIERVRKEWSRNAPVLSVLDHGAIMEHQSVPVNPQIFQNIEFAIGRMNDYAGGRNALGLNESANESGRAVMARAQQGGITRLPLFDKLRLWRLEIAKRLVWWMKNYMSAGQVLRVIGQDQDVQYMDLDDGVLDTLKELSYDIVVDEVPEADTVRDSNFQQMKELFATIPGLPPEIMTKIMIELSNIPKSKKREIMESLGFYQKYIQEKQEAEAQQKMTKEVQDSLMKRVMKEQMLRGEEVEKQKEKIRKGERNVKTLLTDIEKMQGEIASKRGDARKNLEMQDKLRSNEELQSIQSANIRSIQ